ncbi:MAG: 50S ribosomal protein L10 [Phycisphaera sp.]|nr:50S ribosomal protein L10 [Phycisphaera sp.]
MSKPVKNMIIEMYRKQFDGTTDALLVDIRGVNSKDTHALRSGLAQKAIRVTVVKNSLAKKAFEGTGLAPINELIDGPTAVVYGGESVVNVAREMIEIAKKLKTVQLKGAVMEGTIFGPDEIERLSKFPTREEAQAEVIQLLLSPAGNIIGAAVGAGNAIASILKAMEEKLEKGETIAKVG